MFVCDQCVVFILPRAIIFHSLLAVMGYSPRNFDEYSKYVQFCYNKPVTKPRIPVAHSRNNYHLANVRIETHIT